MSTLGNGGGASLKNEGRAGRASEISNDRKLRVGLHALPNSQDSFVQGVPPRFHCERYLAV